MVAGVTEILAGGVGRAKKAAAGKEGGGGLGEVWGVDKLGEEIESIYSTQCSLIQWLEMN